MAYISRITDPKIESQSVEFAHLPNDVCLRRRTNNQITFPIVLRQCDVVVELKTKACRKSRQDRTELKVVTRIAQRRLASKCSCVSCQGCPNRLLATGLGSAMKVR